MHIGRNSSEAISCDYISAFRERLFAFLISEKGKVSLAGTFIQSVLSDRLEGK